MRAYSTREVAELTGLDPARIRSWTRAGVLSPAKDDRGLWQYSFQDLAVLRTAAKLLNANVPLARITRVLRRLRAELPEGRPLSAVSLLVAGNRILIRDRLASWEPESGQGALDFDVAVPAAVSPHAHPSVPEPPNAGQSAADLYHAALDLELAGSSEAARGAYEAALERDPSLVSARINLGRLLHAAGRLDEAETLYRTVLEHAPQSAIAAFNLGVALEDQGKPDAATEAYLRALAADANHADAHYNLSRLLEAQGDARGALRHLNAFRRLMRQD